MKKLPVAGFVLAGGQSSRMGQDKALLVLDGQTLVERAVQKLDEICASVAIAGGSASVEQLGERFGTVLQDERAGCGPLGGIVAALANTELDWCLFLPVDVPLIPVEFLRALAERALESSAAAVIPRTGGRMQPLCAVYRRRTLPSLRQSLSEGQFKVMTAVERSGQVEVLDVAGEADWFTNANTPEEFGQMVEQRSRDGFKV